MQPLNHMNTSLSAKSLLKSKTLNNYTLQTRERTKEGFLAKKIGDFFYFVPYIWGKEKKCREVYNFSVPDVSSLILFFCVRIADN